MTSGNLLNLDAVASIGPFEEKLFIDCVDMDYCLRLRRAGFRIIRDHSVGLQHSLGDFRTGKVGSIRIGYSNHNAGRRYYITRNKIYLLKKYFRFDPRLGWLVIRSMAGDTLRILLFEHNKFGKLSAILTGLRHSLTNHYGSYSLKGAKSRTL
jgi:rhamnosyltransferase